MMVASAVNDKGEIYPVKWTHNFMDLPEVKDQRTPALSAEEVSMIGTEIASCASCTKKSSAEFSITA